MRIRAIFLIGFFLSLGRILPAQKIDEFRVPTARAGSGDVTAGPDGALWFTEGFIDKIGRCTVDGQVTEFPLPNGVAGAISIRVGPDGALWFTELIDNRIGRITTDGHVTFFTIPGPQSGVLSIAAGPDGALWFTCYLTGKIGRLTTAGEFSFFTIPVQNTTPFGITAGQDGALWITQSPDFLYFLYLAGAILLPLPVSASPTPAIWRLSTDGHFTKFTSPSLMSDLNWIVPGPDGALWFTQNQIDEQTAVLSSSAIGRITTSGEITTFPLPNPASGALALTVGTDDALWFTEPQFAANRIGRMTISGAFSEVKIPTAKAVPAGIATGSDGKIWFAESSDSVGRIGRLTPGTGCVAVPSRECAAPGALVAPVSVRGRGRS